MLEIIIKIVLLIVAVYLTYRIIVKIKDLKAELKDLKAKTTFKNDVARRVYLDLLNFLKSKRSKLSVNDKVAILGKWSDIMLWLPIDATKSIDTSVKSFDKDNDTLTQAEHKKAIIEALEVLVEEKDELLVDEIGKVMYHLLHLVLK